jgi:hypothetical protein
VARQVAVLDDHAGPDLGEEPLAVDERAVPLDEREQHADVLRREPDRAPLARERPLRGIEPERPEVVSNVGVHPSGPPL